MKKIYRIKKNEEFTKIISKRHSSMSASFVVYHLPKKEAYARIGISVPKKIGNAVERNKIKRQVREMVYSLIDFDVYSQDLIIIIRKEYLQKEYLDNKNDLEMQIKKAII